jgi:hypothetical protein
MGAGEQGPAASPRKVRDASFELMRICALWLTVWIHIKVFGGVKNFSDMPQGRFKKWPYYAFLTTHSLFSTSINALLLISGYFGVNSRFNPRRLFMLWVSIWVYTNTGTKVAEYVEWIGHDWEFFWYICHFPILQGSYNFHTQYMLLSLIAPMLHMTAKALSKRQFQLVCVVLFVLEINSCTVDDYVFAFHDGRSLPHFASVYFTGCYFRLHGSPFPGMGNGIGFVLLLLLQNYCQDPGLEWIFEYKRTRFLKPLACSLPSNKMKFSGAISLVLSYMLLLVFRSFSITTPNVSKPICFMASHVFAIYCIHAHQAFLKPFPQRLFRCWEFQESGAQSIGILGLFTTTVVVACVTIDLFREFVFAVGEEGFDWGARGWKKVRFLWLGYKVGKRVLLNADGTRERISFVLEAKEGFVPLK